MRNYASNSYNPRRAVKDIAIASEALERENGDFRAIPKSTKSLAKVERKLTEHQQNLNSIRSRGISYQEGDLSAMSNVRSVAVLTAAAGTRLAAIAAATGVGVVEGTTAIVLSPILGCMGGAIDGYNTGARNRVGIAKPVTATGCMGVGAVAGTINGAFGMITAGPVTVATPWSRTRRAFRLIDQYPKARAHVERKRLTTREIAGQAERRLEKTLEDVRFISGPKEMLNGFCEAVAGFNPNL